MVSASTTPYLAPSVQIREAGGDRRVSDGAGLGFSAQEEEEEAEERRGVAGGRAGGGEGGEKGFVCLRPPL